ncbi:hypothetical protein EVC30_105 [Rhizobium phage RHph_Y1_11]|nr:hypothetical protein EVC30_105 [Rhizobium phage RHph_Y1_11]
MTKPMELEEYAAQSTEDHKDHIAKITAFMKTLPMPKEAWGPAIIQVIYDTTPNREEANLRIYTLLQHAAAFAAVMQAQTGVGRAPDTWMLGFLSDAASNMINLVSGDGDTEGMTVQ